jgi:hypothetical protein
VTRPRPLEVLVALATAGTLSSVAQADAEEHRFAVGATGVFASTTADGGEAVAPLGALELRYGYGWKNWLELGGVLFGAGGPRSTFEAAIVDDDPGDLRATVVVAGAGLQVRLVGGVELAREFWRTHPFLSFGGGLIGRALRDQQLFAQDGAFLKHVDDDYTLLPYGEIELGVEHRFSGGFSGSLAGGGRYAGNAYAAASVRLDLAWYWF